MFSNVAVTLLKMAGHSGTIPSAIMAGDVAIALSRLREGLVAAGREKECKPSDSEIAEGADTPAVGLQLRAYPLIQLLSAAAEQGCDVMWEEDRPVV